MLYAGLDFRRGFSYITVMNDKGEVVGQKRLPTKKRSVAFTVRSRKAGKTE